MRSPLAYPLNRSADMDVGGAADLQTDVMRFMAIISLCLVAIFALVQSMPMTPPAEPVSVVDVETPVTVVDLKPEPNPLSAPPPPEPVAKPVEAPPRPSEPQVKKPVVLTRPKWTPKPMPVKRPVQASEVPVEIPKTNTLVAEVAETDSAPLNAPLETAPPVPEEPDVEDKGFTLRFASDIALTRLVAGNQVGFYAIDEQRAKRMTVSKSSISFWDASTPNSFHEMEKGTVPDAVIDALSRAGVEVATVSWGVTLPGELKRQLDGLMQEHRGGSLVIETNGTILWEASQ